MNKEITRAETIKEKQLLFSTKTLSESLKQQSYSELSKLKTKWTDNLFPPTDCSLFSGKTEFSGYIPPQVPKFINESTKTKFVSQYSLNQRDNVYEWKRLSDVFKPNELNVLKLPPNFKDDPDVICEDVVQGGLGDCYFLSAISALAEYPDRIKKLIPNLSFTHSGVFEAQVYIHGELTGVVIDDYFPFTLDGQIAFVGLNTLTKNIWPMILEKVWAKVNLTYEDIIAGNSSEAFEFLTPAPIDTFYHDVHSGCLFEEIENADKKDYIICTDVTLTENSNIDHLTKMGLITNHAYTIIDVARIQHEGREVKLLKIRNPWGTNEWLGDWSDHSSKWTPELKKQLQFEAEEDGTYWISYEDFCKFYTSSHICKLHDNYKFVNRKYQICKKDNFNLVSVEIPSNSSGFFIVNLKNRRIYRNAKGIEDFNNLYCSVMVFRKEKDKYVYIGATCGRDNRLYVECENMVKGTYYVAVSFPMKTDINIGEDTDEEIKRKQTDLLIEGLSYRVGVYSPFEKLEIELEDQEDEITEDFLYHCITDMANQNPNKYFLEDEGEKDSWRAISFERDAGSIGYIFYENNSDGFIHEHLTFSVFNNLNLVPMLKRGEVEELDVDHESLAEDPYTRNAITALKTKTVLESKVKVINAIDKDREVSEDNPLEIVVSIAPKSKCIILVDKTDEDAAIELGSRIAITYPTFAILPEVKFPAKKSRVKYNNKFVEIYECVIEHNSGVIFKYKNKTQDLRMTAHITFPELENLKLSLRGEDLIEVDSGKGVEVTVDETKRNYDTVNTEFELEDPEREIVITLEPGEIKFFELSAIDVFDSFAYSCDLDYHINLSRTRRIGARK